MASQNARNRGGLKVIECSVLVNQPTPSRHDSNINVKILLTNLQNGSTHLKKLTVVKIDSHP